MTNFTHAIEALELRSVLEWIARGCVNEGARERVMSLAPTTDAEAIARSLREIDIVRRYQEDEGRLPVADVTDVAGWVRRAVEHNDVVPPEGLLAIASVERAAIDLVRRMKDAEGRFAVLRNIVASFSPHKELVAGIDKAIALDGTIADKASPRLAGIRKRMRAAREDARGHADKLANQLGSTQAPTYTGSRYLLVIPRERARKGDGVVHSASQSGGSLYLEPLSLVERNNTLETLVADERIEESRILTALTMAVVDVAPTLESNFRTWERLDVLSAVARYAAKFGCTDPDASHGDIRLVSARHPLLELSIEKSAGAPPLVPLDLTLATGARVLVITGPNAGGKTVALKTLGLLSLLFQCGLPVPAREGTALPLFDRIFADVGDEQSISSSLSTFTSHLRHLDAMVRESGTRSLCLIDEIGDGTDPDEGAALAIATIERLLTSGAAVVATTHYGRVKAFALEAEGVSNASMLFDDDDDHPLYRLLQGTAGRSRGIATARRLGFCAPVVEKAERILGEEAFRLEELLDELEASRVAIERERESVQRESESLKELIDTYAAKNRELAEFKSTKRAAAQREAEELLVRARREIESMVKRIRVSGAERSDVRRAHEHIRDMLEEARKVETPPTGALRPLDEVAPGDTVAINPSGSPRGRVISVDKHGVTVEINGKRINIKMDGLYAAESDGDAESKPPIDIQVSADPLETTTLDVRGRDREEALDAVDRFLDRAVLAGVASIKIIHGVGEGILLEAIRTYLEDDPRIGALRPGGAHEGGAGVSFADLR